MKILYLDEDILVCIKPPRVLSTDEAGGLPELLRKEMGMPRADIRTVHRLDRVVGGLMVLARNASAASKLSRQIRENQFEKEYLAIVHGVPEEAGTLIDLLFRDKRRKMTMVATQPGKGALESVLHYRRLDTRDALSLVKIQLLTGRTHQIRVQFSSRGMPLVGERKYAQLDEPWEIALWSAKIGFVHPRTGKKMVFSQLPEEKAPWSMFSSALEKA